MLHPIRTVAVAVLPLIVLGTAGAAGGSVATPVPDPVPVAPAGAPAPEVDLPLVAEVPPVPALHPAPAPRPPAVPLDPPAAPAGPAPGIVRPGTAEQRCFSDKEEYLDVWHQTGIAPDPCFIPPA